MTQRLHKMPRLLQTSLRLPLRVLSTLFSFILRMAMAFILNCSWLRRAISILLQKMPFIYWRLFKFGERASLPVTGQAVPIPTRTHLSAINIVLFESPATMDQLKGSKEQLSVDEILRRIRIEITSVDT